MSNTETKDSNNQGIFDQKEFLRFLFSSGNPIYYSEDEYPWEVIEEFPDGRRNIVDCREDGTSFVVRAIEPIERNL